MSSTNRGSVRQASDYYVTPVDQIQLFLDRVLQDYPDLLKGTILDPCAGGDWLHDMSYPVALQSRGVFSKDIITLDIREDSRANLKGDYLQCDMALRSRLIITNPPFSHSIEITEKAIHESCKYVVMLQRLNWLGSAKRLPFWRAHMPDAIYVHPFRMSFTGGTTDSIEYAHFLWQVDTPAQETRLVLL